MSKIIVAFIIACLCLSKSEAQYAPAAGQPGTTAIYQDSSLFFQWANTAELQRGYINLADTSLGKASFGNTFSALGKADNDVVSLGDGGSAILSFANPVINGLGWDFAVFENSFDGSFLELAFVEVSSDGINFFRFPAHSLTQDSIQNTTFGTMNPEKINNLAGKYKVGYGTPFDLEELQNISGLDINNIIKIKIIDVVGSIDATFATYDTAGNKINDPWPSNFTSSGFDLDAVGVIHSSLFISDLAYEKYQIKIFPNPASYIINIDLLDKSEIIQEIDVYNSFGQNIKSQVFSSSSALINVENFPLGLYFIKLQTKSGKMIMKQIVVL